MLSAVRWVRLLSRLKGHLRTLAWPMAMSLKRRAEAVTPRTVAWHPTYPRGVSKGLLRYAPVTLAAALAGLLYEQTAIEFIHQPSFQLSTSLFSPCWRSL
jgi:hypothetical protein